jgi:hypothetical protein
LNALAGAPVNYDSIAYVSAGKTNAKVKSDALVRVLSHNMMAFVIHIVHQFFYKEIFAVLKGIPAL